MNREENVAAKSAEGAPGENTAEATAPPAGLVVDEVRVRNFRSLVDVAVPLEPTTTYLVGENNSGKSSLLLAIATACGSRKASTDDLYRAGDGSSAREATVDLLIRSIESEFREEVGQRLAANSGSGPRPGEWTGVRTTLTATREGPLLATRRSFLQWDPRRGDWIDTANIIGEKVLELVTSQLVEASRDLTAELSSRTSDWGRVLTDLGVGAEDRRVLEAELEGLAGRLHEASPIFGTLRSQLSKIAQAQSGVDEVNLQALPVRLEELAQSVEVIVASGGRSGLPLRYQGLGSRSLAALMVFHALCEVRVGADQGIRPHILTLLEEPEAHLHPQAQAAVRRLVTDLPGQVVVATHSTVLIAEADPRSVRVLRAADPGAIVHVLKKETAKKIGVFRRYVERPHGELFFARLVVFVDGTAERTALPVMLEPLLGKDPAGAGVTFVELEGMNSERCEKAIDAMEELGGIPWLVFVDNDEDGLAAIDGVKGSDGEALDPGHDQVVVSGRKQLEQLVLDAGYHAEVQEIANVYSPWGLEDERHGQSRLPDISEAGADGQYLEFLAANKGWVAEHVARRAVRNGQAMPAPIVILATRIRNALGIAEPVGDRYRTAAGLDVDATAGGGST
jgi:putative ATP-dependent endonuclease of OLD family